MPLTAQGVIAGKAMVDVGHTILEQRVEIPLVDPFEVLLRDALDNGVVQVRDVWVKGLPHDTTIIVRWTATDELPDGSPYENHGVHIVKMRWGKIVEIDANEDSQAVADSLKMRAAFGIEEAAAPPILSYLGPRRQATGRLQWPTGRGRWSALSAWDRSTRDRISTRPDQAFSSETCPAAKRL